MSSLPYRVLFAALVAFGSLGVLEASADVPLRMSYQGFLRDNTGEPVTSPDVNFAFHIFSTEAGGSSCWGPENHLGVDVVDGFFELQLGSIVPLDPACFDGTAKWLETWVNGAPLSPRKPLTSVPYAFGAGSASGEPSGFLVRLIGTPFESLYQWDEVGGYDDGGDFANNAFVAPAAGRYLFTFHIGWVTTTTVEMNELAIYFRKNGVVLHNSEERSWGGSSGISQTTELTTIVDAVAGDVFDILEANRIGDLTIGTDMLRSWWAGRVLRP